MKVWLGKETQTKLAAEGLSIPMVKGTAEAIQNPFYKALAVAVNHSGWICVAMDQLLGRETGRTFNNEAAAVAAGKVVLKPPGFDATVQRQKEKPEERPLEIFGVLKRKKLPFAKPTPIRGVQSTPGLRLRHSVTRWQFFRPARRPTRLKVMFVQKPSITFAVF